MAAAENAATPKLHGYEFWRSIGSPTKIIAPMVDQSELTFRMLTRQHGADLCYTPMFNSKVFVQTKSTGDFVTVPEDRPLFVQFCGNDPDTLLAAAKMVEDQCDAIDINLGCPQGIARSGHYGSFLLEEPELLERIVAKLHAELKVPVTAKIRLLPSLATTISLAKRLEAAGISVLTVHGRTKEEKKTEVGLCDWDAVMAIKKVMNIPVVLNGGIADYADYERAMQDTQVDGVMTSEAVLENPALFSKNTMPGDGSYATQIRLARSYLELCQQYDSESNKLMKYVRAHLFKILYWGLMQDKTLCERLSNVFTLAEISEVVDTVEARAVTDGWEEPHFNAEHHPAEEKEFNVERSWYARYAKNTWTRSTVLGDDGDVRGQDKWHPNGPPEGVNTRKRKKQASVCKPATCGTCKQEFPSRSKMFKHIREEHDKTA